MIKLFSTNIWVQIATFPFIFIVVLILISEFSVFTDSQTSLDKTRIKETVEKYAIQCYASEGSYPPNIEYLEKEYGLIVDRDKYIYDYEIFASNIMPYITILDNKGYEGEQGGFNGKEEH